MRRAMRRTLRMGAGALLMLAATAAWANPDPEDLRTAKALFFDKKYEQARDAWSELRSSGAPGADVALFWMARCSDSLGDRERALREYGEFLAGNPGERALAEEARTSRIGLAARLYKEGRREHLPIVRQGLGDASATVRYYAAFQLAGLGPEVGRAAVPVLKKILLEERDEDLVERAKLGLLRIEPNALSEFGRGARSPAEAERPGPREATWIRVRFYEKGSDKATVSINLPMALAELVYKSLPDDARSDLRKQGYDADNFWEGLKKLGPTDIIEIVGDEGGRIRIWIE